MRTEEMPRLEPISNGGSPFGGGHLMCQDHRIWYVFVALVSNLAIVATLVSLWLATDKLSLTWLYFALATALLACAGKGFSLAHARKTSPKSHSQSAAS